MADEGEASPPADAPPPAEEAPPPAEAPRRSAVARPSAASPQGEADAPPRSGEAAPPATDRKSLAVDAGAEAQDKPRVEFAEDTGGEADEGRKSDTATPDTHTQEVKDLPEPPTITTDDDKAILPVEEGEGEDEAKSVERIDDEVDSILSFDEEKLDSAMDTKEQAIEKKRVKALGSTISIRKGNQEFLDRAKAPKYMNSYKLESDKPFNHERVQVILKEVLSEIITDDLVYEADKVMKQAKWASGVIRDKVKEQEYDRYKIVCVVTIGEKKSQDVYSIFRFLWDSGRDKFATYVHENMRVYAIALCFGLYYE